MSGKSAICSLLAQEFKSRNYSAKVVHLNSSGMKSDIDFDEFKREFFEISKFKWNDVLANCDFLLILDDAHNFYHLDVFSVNLAIMGSL